MDVRARKPLTWLAIAVFGISSMAPIAEAQGVPLDLSSTTQKVPASTVLPGGSAAIVEAGRTRVITPSASLTPGEAMALSQVVSAGRQTIQIGAAGNAVGGSFVLNAGVPVTAGDLVIPQNVRAIINYSVTDKLNLAGNLIDLGALFAISTNRAITEVSLSALGINVGQGASLTTILPPGGLSGFSQAVPNVSLNLSAANDIVNFGTISSAANLSMRSGGTFVNHGLIASQSGNVTFSTIDPGANLIIDNTGGRVEAAQSINIREAGYGGIGATRLVGGDWLSSQLNINGGAGAADVNIGIVSGQIYTSADTAHISAATPTLKLGDQCILGDPTFYNKAGDIQITGNVTANENIAIIASGNIFATVADTGAKITSNGHAISLIAGAHIDDSACIGCTSTTSTPPGNPVVSGQTIAISAPSGGDTGGNIDLQSSGQTIVIDSTSSSGAGGDVSLVAFSGATAGTGNINLGTRQINASGTTFGGDVTAIAGATSGQSFQSGSITTNGGSVSISAATPVVPGGTITADSTGTISAPITAGSLQTADTFISGNVNTSSLYGTGGSFSMSNASNNSLRIGSATTNGITGTLNVAGMDTAHYGDITITSMGNSSSKVILNQSIAAANISIKAADFTVPVLGTTLTAYGTSLSSSSPAGVVILEGNGNDSGMTLNQFSSLGGKFNVTTDVFSAVKAGRLVLKDPIRFDYTSFLQIDLSSANSFYDLAIIGTSPNAVFAPTLGFTIGTHNLTIYAGGGIATDPSNSFSIFSGSVTNANSGSVILVSGRDIGNTSKTFSIATAASGSTGNSGNILLVAGADNVTVANDASSIQIGPNTGSAAGGSINIPNAPFTNGLFTTNFAGAGNRAGDITLVALKGTTADSGQVNTASTSTFNIEAGSINGTAGDITIVAGATSSATAGGGTGYTIRTGPIGTNYGFGNLLISTSTPNLPITINTTSSAAGGAGAIVSGGVTGGAPVDGAISTGSIANFSMSASSTGANSIRLLAGSNAAGPSARAISVGSIQGNTSRPTDISLISGIAGTGNIGTNGYNINTGFFQAGSGGSIFISSVDSINVGADSFGMSILAGTSPIVMLAGQPTTAGTITVAATILGSGGISIASVGSTGTIFIGGTGSNGSINANGTNAGSIAVSSLNGTLTFTGQIGATGSAGNGDVLLTSGSIAANSIIIANSVFGIVTGQLTALPGQIYIITRDSTSQSNVSTANTTQSTNSTRAANPVLAVGGSSSVGSGLTDIVFTPDNIALGQTGSVSGYSAGGFTSISDSGGAVDLRVTMAGSPAVADTKLLLPIVSGGTFNLGTSAGSIVEVGAASNAVPNFVFAGPSSVTLGTNSNQLQMTTNGLGSFSATLASNGGDINVVKGGTTTQLNLTGTVGSGNVSIADKQATVSIQGAQNAALSYVASAGSGLALGGNIYAPNSVTLESGTSTNADITRSTGTIFTNSLTLANRSGTASGTIGSGASNIVFYAPSVTATLAAIGTNIYLSAMSSTSATISGATPGTVQITENGVNALLSVSNILTTTNLTLQTISGSGGNIYINGNVESQNTRISADGNLSSSALATVRGPIVSLTATTGSIGSSTSPLNINNGGGALYLFASAGNDVYLNNPSGRVFMLNSTAASSAGRSFNLQTALGIFAADPSELAISSPSISLTSGGAITGDSFLPLFPLYVQGNGTSLLVSASSSGGDVSLRDLTTETVVLANGLSTPSASGTYRLYTGGSILAQSDSHVAVSAFQLDLESISASIGASNAPLILTRNSGGALPVTLIAQSDTAGLGNVYATRLDGDISVLTGTAGFAFPDDSTSGNFHLTAPSGSISIDGQLTGTTSVVLDANGDILSGVAGLIKSSSITMASATGNIGSSVIPISFTRTTFVAAPTHITTTATANTSGNGNIYLVSGNNQGAVIDSATAGSGTPVDNTTGNFSLATTVGDITVDGPVSGSTSVALESAGSIFSGATGQVNGPTVNLTASAGIGSPLQPLAYNASTLNVSATDSTNGNVYLFAASPTLNIGTINIGNTLQVTVPLTVNVSILNPFTPSIPNLGLVTATGGGGDIIIDSDVVVGDTLTLIADGSIIDGGGGKQLTALTISLTATNGNIGDYSNVITSGGGTTHLTASAPSNASNSGNVYFTASGDLIVDSATAGSGTPVDTTTGNLNVSSAGSLTVGGPISATTSIDLQGASGITQTGAGSVSAPTVSLTSATGNIGSALQSIKFTAETANLSATNALTGKAFLESTDGDFVFGTVNLANALELTVDQTISISKLQSAASTPSITLTTKAGSSADILVGDTVFTVSHLKLVADGSIVQSGAFSIIADQLDLTAVTGNVGDGAQSVRVGANSADGLVLSVQATTNAANKGNVWVASTDLTRPLLLNTSSAGSGTAVDTTTGRFLATSMDEIVLIGDAHASTHIRLATTHGLGASNGAAITSPSIEVSATNGDVGFGAGPSPGQLIIGNDGNGVKVYAFASNGSVHLVDTSSETVTLNNGLGTGVPFAADQFYLDVQGSIAAWDGNSSAVSSPTINLSATGGNISADGTTTGTALLLDSRGSATGLQLNARATQVGGIGGTVIIAAGEAVQLQNQSSVLGGPAYADVSFSLRTNGNISVEDAGSAAIQSPVALLVSYDGNITADGTASGAPMRLANDGVSGVEVALRVIPTNGLGGTANLQVAGEPLVFGIADAKILQATSDVSVETSGPVTAEAIAFTAPNVINSGSMTAQSGAGAIVINGTGGDLNVSGNGAFNANQMTFTAFGANSINFSGAQTLNANAIMNALGGTVNVTGAPVQVNGNLIVNVNNTFNVGGFTVSGSETINFPASNVSVGTLINTTGDVVLGAKTIVNSGGKNLAIVASGSVIANGATTINLSNAKGEGGSLTVIAGYDFTPATSGQVLDTSNPYTLQGPSASGGNIDLGQVKINTSSSAPASVPNGAGSILMVASGGTDAAGSIVVGSLTATSTNGSGGSVTLLGSGGAIVKGNIATTGKTAGGDVTIVGAPAIAVGSIQVQNGYLQGGLFAPGTPVQNAGAAVIVNGTIKTNSAAGHGGSVMLAADQQISSGAITTTGAGFKPSGALLVGPGGTFAGDVDIQSLQASVKTGAISANASNLKAAAVGDGGSIQILAGTSISTGTLLANGAANLSTTAGDGGAGGSVSLVSSATAGIIKVTGFINTAGGAASKAGGDGGSGGDVQLDGVAVAVTGATGGNSILASQGAGASTGQGGQVTIHTYSIQPLPTNLDLNSTARNIVALPGGMFSVGSAGTPNGVAGAIKSNQVMSKTIAPNGFITAGTTTTPDGSVSVTVTGGDGAIVKNGANFPIPVLTGTRRTLISPAEALALFQTSRDPQASQITVTSSKPTLGGVATGGSADIAQSEVGGQAFTAFKVPNNVTLNFTGTRPVLNLPASVLIAGNVVFPTVNATSFVNAGAGALSISSTGSLQTALSGTLLLSGTGGTWTNNGNVDVGTFVLARPGTGALNFKATANSQTSVETILIDPSTNGSNTITFTGTGVSSFDADVTFGKVLMPTMYSANALAVATSAAKQPAVNLTFSLSQNDGSGGADPITATISGAASVSSLTVKSTPNTFNKVAVQTPVTIAASTELSSAAALSITSAGTLTIGDNAELTASKGNVSLTSKTANIDLGVQSKLEAAAGNIVVLAKGDVTGADTILNATGIGTTATGGIEIGAGTTTSSLSKGFGSKPTPNPSASGAIVIPNASGKQVLLLLPTGTSNISFGSTGTESTLDFTNRGVMVFNAVGTGTIQLQSATFTTSSSRPISFENAMDEMQDDYVIDTDEDSAPLELTSGL